MNYCKWLLLFILLFNCIICSSQNIKYRPKIFTFHNSRISFGLSAESGFTPYSMIGASKPSDLKVIYIDPRHESKPAPYSIGLSIDFYSANSVLGLLTGVDFAKHRMGFQTDLATDYFTKIERIEIPVFLKFRFGQLTNNSHFWLLFGGSYNIPYKVERDNFNPMNSNSLNYIDTNKNQLATTYSVSAMIGTESFSRNKGRLVLYLKGSYQIGSELNQNYFDFSKEGNSVLSSYSNFDIHEYKITAGIKIMLGSLKKSTI